MLQDKGYFTGKRVPFWWRSSRLWFWATLFPELLSDTKYARREKNGFGV
jgi:hypothetical protein